VQPDIQASVCSFYLIATLLHCNRTFQRKNELVFPFQSLYAQVFRWDIARLFLVVLPNDSHSNSLKVFKVKGKVVPLRN
jgi:hypothetical protein